MKKIPIGPKVPLAAGDPVIAIRDCGFINKGTRGVYIGSCIIYEDWFDVEWDAIGHIIINYDSLGKLVPEEAT